MSTGGITNGQDMVAVYLRRHWPGTLSDTVIAMANIDVRPQEYETGKVGFTAWWILHVFKAWVRRLRSTEKNV